MIDPLSGAGIPPVDRVRPAGESAASSAGLPHMAVSPLLCPDRRHGLVASFGCALAGFWHVIKTQRNMRIHLAVGAAVIAAGLALGLDWTQWAVLALTMGFVLVAEMFNTVAEAALDAATPYYHPLVKIAKDVAAGAVLVTALVSVGVGLLVLGPPLWSVVVNWLGG
jgi:diacylglycerol kinase